MCRRRGRGAPYLSHIGTPGTACALQTPPPPPQRPAARGPRQRPPAPRAPESGRPCRVHTSPLLNYVGGASCSGQDDSPPRVETLALPAQPDPGGRPPARPPGAPACAGATAPQLPPARRGAARLLVDYYAAPQPVSTAPTIQFVGVTFGRRRARRPRRAPRARHDSFSALTPSPSPFPAAAPPLGGRLPGGRAPAAHTPHCSASAPARSTLGAHTQAPMRAQGTPTPWSPRPRRWRAPAPALAAPGVPPPTAPHADRHSPPQPSIFRPWCRERKGARPGAPQAPVGTRPPCTPALGLPSVVSRPAGRRCRRTALRQAQRPPFLS
jgi:hypothetical protein